jgi:hypothetical protein
MNYGVKVKIPLTVNIALDNVWPENGPKWTEPCCLRINIMKEKGCVLFNFDLTS